MTNDVQEQFEQELSEKRLEAQVSKAEIMDATPIEANEPTGLALDVTYRTVAGDTSRDVIPMPRRYKPEESDMAALFEFTGANPSDVETLHGKRVPTAEGSVDYGVMRQVLRAEEESRRDWDTDKRLDKAGDLK